MLWITSTRVPTVNMHIHSRLIILIQNIVLNTIPLCLHKIINQMLYGKYSHSPTNSDSVELFKLIFCFEDFPCNKPYTMEIAPPVCHLMFSWTAYVEYIQVNNSSRLLAPITIFSSMVFNIQVRTFPNLFQSSTSLFDTLVVWKATAVSKSGLSRFVM